MARKFPNNGVLEGSQHFMEARLWALQLPLANMEWANNTTVLEWGADCQVDSTSPGHIFKAKLEATKL